MERVLPRSFTYNMHEFRYRHQVWTPFLWSIFDIICFSVTFSGTKTNHSLTNIFFNVFIISSAVCPHSYRATIATHFSYTLNFIVMYFTWYPTIRHQIYYTRWGIPTLHTCSVASLIHLIFSFSQHVVFYWQNWRLY